MISHCIRLFIVCFHSGMINRFKISKQIHESKKVREKFYVGTGELKYANMRSDKV